MVNTILRRKRFKISNFEVLCKGFMKCCCRHRNRLIKGSTWQRYRLIEKAERMLNRKLDVLELLKAVQRNSTLLSAMLAPEQRLLLLYQRKQVVELLHEDDSQTSSSEEEQGNFTQNFQKKIESKNPWDRIKALGRVNQILGHGYVEKEQVLDYQDKKLIKGLYRRALNTYNFN